jgi:hypothetical protein
LVRVVESLRMPGVTLRWSFSGSTMTGMTVV